MKRFNLLKGTVSLGLKPIKVNALAFTLAEILLVIGIIGFVAALTLPTLMTNFQKTQTATRLEKGYTNITQAVKLSENDNGNNSTWVWGTDQASILASFNTYWAPYLRIIKYCNIPSDCGYASYAATYPTDIITGATSYGMLDPTSRTTVVLADGSVLMVKDAGVIALDINAGQGPNVWGKDVFMFILDPTYGFMPYYFYETYSTTNLHCRTINGQYCTAKIMKDGWQIKSDYPW